MKVRVASTLHLGRHMPLMPDDEAFHSVPDRDALVLGGDLSHDLKGRNFVLRKLAVSPMIGLSSDHEYCAHHSGGKTPTPDLALIGLPACCTDGLVPSDLCCRED